MLTCIPSFQTWPWPRVPVFLLCDPLPVSTMKSATASPCWVLLIAWLASTFAQDIEEDMLHYEILEEPIPGTFIANIFADAGIGNKYDAPVLEQLQFRFLAPPELGFTIERDTGILRASSSIDRDDACPQYEECMFRLDVVALIPDPLRFLEIIKVTVQVEDINDNAPVFPESYISHPVLESATTGRIVVISTASDPDSGDYGIQDYELITTSPKFALEINEKLDGSSELELILTEELDREQEDYYNMKVIAYDGGNPPLSGSIDVTITVMDTNDHDPIFDNSTYDVTVEENVPIYSSILRVHASDGDTGLYGQVVYGFSASSQATNGYLFGINNMTGDIYVKDTLDYERGHIYHLTVTAQDQGPDSLTADATVIIRVRDINDNAPQITVNTLAATGTDLAEIAEDAELGTFVAHINVADPDSGANGEFNCSLSDSHFRLQQLYSNEYQIITRADLDRETMPSYNLALLCQDFAPIDHQVAIKHIEVAVIDVNDNTPLFRQTSYMANLIENNPVGTFLTQLNATDQDAGRNAEIEYSIQEDLRDIFHIDPTTGIITTNTVLDHEQVYEFSIRVYATDKGTPRRNSTALLVVYIQDENDERPTFSQEAYSFGVLENEGPHTPVGTVHASDKDSPPNNQMEFLLLSNEDHTFAIDPFSGQISTRVTLDRERQPVYLLIVVATDKGTPPQSSSVSVSVYVDDQNDHAPVILFPSSYNNTVQVSSHAPIGHIITRIVAVDDDIGRNANLTYWLNRGNERDWLRLDALTGRLSVNRDLGSVDFEIYDIQVLVQDQGEPHQLAFATLNVIVNKSIPFSFHEEDTLLGNNFTIVISVACISGVLAVILIVCIIFMLRQKDNSYKNPKYVNTMKVLSVQEANAKNEKELNNIKMDTLKEPVTTTITVDVDNGYVSRTHTLHTPIAADTHDGHLTPNKVRLMFLPSSSYYW